QESRGLPITGRFDDATLAALAPAGVPSLITYSISAGDLDSVGPVPTDWNKKADLDRLRYESLAALLAERGHCTLATLARLNPGRDLNKLSAGAMVTLPNVEPARPLPQAASMEVDLENKTVTPLDRQNRAVAVFHCSVARFVEKLPRGNA